MRTCSTISLAMLAAVTAATEAEWANFELDNANLFGRIDSKDVNDFLEQGSALLEDHSLPSRGDYLTGFGAYEPSKSAPYSAVA
jgi:hypothetical protein